MSEKSNLWYWRKNGKVTGPFPAGLLQKYIILGRLRPDDQVSIDKDIWQRAATVRELIPDVVRHKNDPNYEERLKAARRWADDRNEDREHEVDDSGSRKQRKTHLGISVLGWKGIILVILLVAGVLWSSFYFMPKKSNLVVNCEAKALPKTLFDGCDLSGRDFSGANLNDASFANARLVGTNFSGAKLNRARFEFADMSRADLSSASLKYTKLKGAKLMGANLRKANFTGADLSFANLRDAKANSIRFSQTRLAKTIWFSGQQCAQLSVDKCLIAK